MITPELKDKLLDYIILHSTEMTLSGSSKSLASNLNESESELRAILRQFADKGFIKYDPYMTSEGSFLIRVEAKAHDYFGMGGHVGESRIFELEAEKLTSELLALEKQFGKEPFRDLATAANTLISFFNAFYKR